MGANGQLLRKKREATRTLSKVCYGVPAYAPCCAPVPPMIQNNPLTVSALPGVNPTEESEIFTQLYSRPYHYTMSIIIRLFSSSRSL